MEARLGREPMYSKAYRIVSAASHALVITSFLCLAACADKEPPPAPARGPGNAAKAAELADKLLIVDTHIDVPYRLLDKYEDVSEATDEGHFDYPRAMTGGLNAAFMSIYTPAALQKKGGAKQNAEKLIDMVEEIAKASSGKFALAYTTKDVRRHFRDGRIALPLGMENGAPLEGDLANLQHFYDRGVRYITLAHSKPNDISDSSFDEFKPNGGLSEFGREVVKEMNRLGIMIDISHLSDEAINDVLDITAVPVIASHSSARHFTPGWERNMSDELIQRLAENGGVIQINFGSIFVNEVANAWAKEFLPFAMQFYDEYQLTGLEPEAKAFSRGYKAAKPTPPAYLEDVLNHIDHVVELVGVDHVGIGSDYDGVSALPRGLEDVSKFPNLIAGLLGRGYSEEDIAKILGENLMRVWSAVEEYASLEANMPNVTVEWPGD